MEWVQTLNDAIEYIEEHLCEDIQCEDVSNAVHISSYHFQRAFTLLSGMTIQTYIRNRRLSLAGEELLTPGTKVIDVALKYRYESVESFSKAFQRFHGIAPSKMSKERSLKSFHRISLRIIMEGGAMEYRLEEHDRMKLCIHSKRFTSETSDKEIPKLWEEYYQNELYKKVAGYLGICGQMKENEKEFFYGIGANAEDLELIPQGFEELTIPANTWVIFKSKGQNPDAIQRTWERIYSEWMPSTKHEVIQDYCIENYLPGDSSSTDYVSEIWLPVKRRG